MFSCAHSLYSTNLPVAQAAPEDPKKLSNSGQQNLLTPLGLKIEVDTHHSIPKPPKNSLNTPNLSQTGSQTGFGDQMRSLNQPNVEKDGGLFESQDDAYHDQLRTTTTSNPGSLSTMTKPCSARENNQLMTVHPHISYCEMIVIAFQNLPNDHSTLTFTQICDFIAQTFPFFQSCRAGNKWQRDVWKNLSSKKECFIRIPQSDSSANENVYQWKLHPKYREFLGPKQTLVKTKLRMQKAKNVVTKGGLRRDKRGLYPSTEDLIQDIISKQMHQRQAAIMNSLSTTDKDSAQKQQQRNGRSVNPNVTITEIFMNAAKRTKFPRTKTKETPKTDYKLLKDLLSCTPSQPQGAVLDTKIAGEVSNWKMAKNKQTSVSGHKNYPDLISLDFPDNYSFDDFQNRTSMQLKSPEVITLDSPTMEANSPNVITLDSPGENRHRSENPEETITSDSQPLDLSHWYVAQPKELTVEAIKIPQHPIGNGKSSLAASNHEIARPECAHPQEMEIISLTEESPLESNNRAESNFPSQIMVMWNLLRNGHSINMTANQVTPMNSQPEANVNRHSSLKQWDLQLVNNSRPKSTSTFPSKAPVNLHQITMNQLLANTEIPKNVQYCRPMSPVVCAYHRKFIDDKSFCSPNCWKWDGDLEAYHDEDMYSSNEVHDNVTSMNGWARLSLSLPKSETIMPMPPRLIRKNATLEA